MVLKFLRKKKTYKTVMWVTALMIIPGFLIWGVGISNTSRKKSYAALVNREPVTLQEYYRQMDQTERRYKEIFGDSYDQLASKLNLNRMVLENLMTEKALFQQVRKRHLRVSDIEILEAFKADPTFKDEQGSFSQEKFNRIVRNIPVEELKTIENEIRQKMLVQKLKQEIVATGNVSITDREVDEYVARMKDAKGVDREQVRKALLTQKQEMIFSQWVQRIRKDAKTEIYVEFPPEQASATASATGVETGLKQNPSPNQARIKVVPVKPDQKTAVETGRT